MVESTMVPQAAALFHEHQQSVYRRTDKMFAVLMVAQWIAGILAALWISPRAWSGTSSSLHPHVLAAVLLAGLITALPVSMAILWPGRALTRHVIAVSQMLISALLIHLTGGRIETHFHVFGSLAFLACYRDWRVLISATLVIVLDHLIRGIVWPFSVYGVLTAPIWRSFEHGGWVVFEDVILIAAIRQSVAEMVSMAKASEAKSETAAELSRSKEALRKQTQILESVLTSMGDGVIVADSQGEFLVFNPAAQQIVGQGRTNARPNEWSETYGLYKTDTITPYPIDELPLVRAVRGESTDGVEMFVHPCSSDGGNWISATGRPLIDSCGSLVGGVVVFRDITAAKQSEEALQNAKRTAEAANRSKTEFLANMSHEIRTPLSSILGFTELLRRDIGSPDDRTTYLDTITNSGHHLSALIDDILDVSKIEAGRMEFERVRCSPHQIISEVLSVLRVRAHQKSLSLECQWRGGVPETILSDPARARQLLMNLVGNAIKFTEQGGVTLNATLVQTSAEPQLVIEVCDTGIGIPPERIQSIFNPFEQADSSITRRFGGTGLGLAISRHIAEGLGRGISVESTLGVGTVFRVVFATGPLHEVRIMDAAPCEALAPTDSSRMASIGTLPPCQILLVEDGESNQQLISLILQEAGAEVTCAANGQEGVRLATSRVFDLILMDMQMPVMDGYTATTRLRELGCELPIIALTAHAMRGDREKCLASGCSGYLTKPIDIDRLVQTVADGLSRQESPSLERPSPCVINACEPAAIVSTLPHDNPRFRDIVEIFVEKLHQNISVMQIANREMDWQTVAELAHWLKGSGGTVGFDCFTEPARRLEAFAKQAQFASAQSTLDEIAQLALRIFIPSHA
jgi:two-component system, sensor histidine kinase and response regulator